MTAYVIRRTVGKTTGQFEYWNDWVNNWMLHIVNATLFVDLDIALPDGGEIVEIELVEKGVVQ